jgi:hypothetical protein
MAIDSIGNHRFYQCSDGHSVVGMTIYGTPPAPAAPVGTSRPRWDAAEPRLDLL